MKDISILSCFGIKTDDLESYEITDKGEGTLSLLVKKKRLDVSCKLCGSFSIKIKDYKLKHYFFRNINGYDIEVFYKQRRFVCNDCKKTFLEKNPFINNSNYVLSSLKIASIINRLKESLSIKQIADYTGISISSVFKVLDKYYCPNRKKLSEVICIDEFMSFNCKGISKYSCLLIDFKTGHLLDVIRSRETVWLSKYFSNISIEERKNVNYLIMDMYLPYKVIAKRYLPNAVIAIDPFHYIRYTTYAIERVRINTMKLFKETSEEYKLLKKFRRLLLTKSEPNYLIMHRLKFKNNNLFNEEEILNLILNINDDLKTAYYLGHSFLKDVSCCNYNDFKEFMLKTISRYNLSNIKEFNEVGMTYSNWLTEIVNSKIVKIDNRNLSNGLIEGINNKVKVLKRVSYGLTNFQHLRKRLFLLFMKDDPTKK